MGGGRWRYLVAGGRTQASFVIKAEHVHEVTIDALAKAAIDAVYRRRAAL